MQDVVKKHLTIFTVAAAFNLVAATVITCCIRTHGEVSDNEAALWGFAALMTYMGFVICFVLALMLGFVKWAMGQESPKDDHSDAPTES